MPEFILESINPFETHPSDLDPQDVFMNFALTDEFIQLIAWFSVLLACITGFYCLVINFGRRLNRFVFLLAVLVAIRFFSLGVLVGITDPILANWLQVISLEMRFLLGIPQFIVTVLLLQPDWWDGRLQWLTKGAAGLNLIFPLILLVDVTLGTHFYYGGLNLDLYAGGYVAAEQIVQGSLFSLLNFLSLFLSQALTLSVIVYVLLFDKTASHLTRVMASLILGSIVIFIAILLLPVPLHSELLEVFVTFFVGSIGYLAAIFLKIFSEHPFRRGSLQTRLFSVVMVTAIPILIAVGLLSQFLGQVFWAAIILGIILLVTLTWLTIRYSIQPINTLTQTVLGIAEGDLTRTAPVESEDEIGVLGQAFNSMTEQLQGSIDELEERVMDRTQELERRAAHLETSSRVGQHITSILDQDELLHEVVDLIQAGFGYYFVSVWLLSDREPVLILQASAGRGGQRLKQNAMLISMDTPCILTNVCQTGTYRMVGDVRQAPDYLPDEDLADTRSELSLPLRISDETIGILDIQSDELETFNRYDMVIFQTLADEIAIAVRNAQLYEGEQRRRQLAEALEQTGRELSSSLDVREVPGLILEQLARVVPYERCAVLLQQDQMLQVVAQRGFPEDRRLQNLQIPIRQDDIFQQVVGTSQPVLLDNVTSEPGWQQVDWLPLNLSWLGAPLVSQDRVIGMISLTRQEVSAFSHEDARLVSVFAGQAAIALKNANLYDEISRLNGSLEQTVAERTEALNSAYHDLERLDKTKSDFINIVAHELRTPLTIIRGYTQVLGDVREEQGQDTAPDMLLDGILSGVGRMQEIVDSMLDLTRLENQVLQPYKEDLFLADIIERVRGNFTFALTDRNLILTINPLDHLPCIQADPDLLYKVFYHLIMNAIKYVPDGGMITVAGEIVSQPENDPKVEIVISDTGIGIDPAHHALIFEKFYQTGELSVHSTGQTKFKGGGPGLGLAIAQGIVMVHDGKIWVESDGHDEETYPGSRFYVQLPLGDCQQK